MRIFLRPVTLADGEMIVKWRNSPKVRAFCFNKTPITEETNKTFYISNIETGRYLQFIVERVEEDYGVASYPIATVYLKDIDIINHRCELCIYTSDDQEWNTESKSMAIKILLNKSFNELNMNKVYSYVFSTNHDEIALMKRAGLIEEALLSCEAVDLNGAFVDVIRMAAFKESYCSTEAD